MPDLGHLDLAGIGPLEPGQDTQDGRLARAGQPHQRDDLPRGGLQVYAVEDGAAAPRQAQPAHAQRRAHDGTTFQRCSSRRAR